MRQGDLLSCALFNLAIEPLTYKIRSDKTLKGISIPGIEEKVIISLYADNINLFLSNDNNLDVTATTLDCKLKSFVMPALR